MGKGISLTAFAGSYKNLAIIRLYKMKIYQLATLAFMWGCSRCGVGGVFARSRLSQQQQHIQFCKALHSRSPLICSHEQYHALPQERSSLKYYWKIPYPHRVHLEQPPKRPWNRIPKCYFQHPYKSQPVVNRPFLPATPFTEEEKQPRTQCSMIYMEYEISVASHITVDALIPQVHTHHNK